VYTVTFSPDVLVKLVFTFLSEVLEDFDAISISYTYAYFWSAAFTSITSSMSIVSSMSV
jgi:hypothetical protein